jgi:hypothetical protein
LLSSGRRGFLCALRPRNPERVNASRVSQFPHRANLVWPMIDGRACRRGPLLTHPRGAGYPIGLGRLYHTGSIVRSRLDKVSVPVIRSDCADCTTPVRLGGLDWTKCLCWLGRLSVSAWLSGRVRSSRIFSSGCEKGLTTGIVALYVPIRISDPPASTPPDNPVCTTPTPSPLRIIDTIDTIIIDDMTAPIRSIGVVHIIDRPSTFPPNVPFANLVTTNRLRIIVPLCWVVCRQ